jgi:hypothetical protein
MDKQPLHNLMDACRPRGDDLLAPRKLLEPEMAALADELERDETARQALERSQRLDRALVAAFQDVPVPGDLERRLLAAVGAAGGRAAAAASESVAAVAPADRADLSSAARQPQSRRRFWALAMAAAVGFIALGLSYWLVNHTPELTPSQLVVQAQEWLSDEDFHRAAWSPMTSQPPRAYPRQYLAVAPAQWRRVETSLDRKAVVYQIPFRQGKSAYLFVSQVDTPVAGIGSVPPRTPLPGATGGWSIGAWQADGLLFVLAVEGDYRSLLRSRPTA